MKRAIILGPYGAGKSTFARRLCDKTGLPLYYLDNIWFLPDRTSIDQFVFEARVFKLAGQDRWIIEGNYLNCSVENRLIRSDAIFLLDFPPDVCIDGIRERAGKRTESRPFVERVGNGDLIAKTRAFRENSMPRIYELIRRYGRGREVWVFHSRREADEFLETL